MNTLEKDKVTIDEMREFYTANSPFEPNPQRVGRFAKKNGYVLSKQMKNRKYEYFYLRIKIS